MFFFIFQGELKPSGNGLDWEVSEEHWQQKKPQESPRGTAVDVSVEPASARATTAPASPQSTKAGPVGQSVMHMSTLRRAPKYSFRGVKDRFQTRGLQAASQVPGPGAYGRAVVAPEVLSSRHRKSPGYGFGTSAKQGDIEIRAPGPGTYPRASAGFVGGKAFSLTPRRWPGPGPPPDQGSHLSPGPGAHDVDKSIRGPSYSISPRRAPDKGAALVPGPSQYGTMDRALGQTKPKLPSWGFGTTKRPGHIFHDDRPVPGVKGKSGASAWLSKLPGPGSYNTPSTVGEGPKYSVGARRNLSRKVLSPGPGDTGGPYTTFV